MPPRGKGGLASFFWFSRGEKKITRLVKIQSEHIVRCGTWTKPSSRVPSRSNSPGHHSQWVLAHPLLRPTALHLRRHSNLFSAAGWHALRPNSLSQDALPSIPLYLSLPLFSVLPSLSLCLFSRYLILFPYIFIFFSGLIYRRLPPTIYIPDLTKRSY